MNRISHIKTCLFTFLVLLVACSTGGQDAGQPEISSPEPEPVAPVLVRHDYDISCASNEDCVLVDLRCQRCCPDSAVANESLESVIEDRDALVCEAGPDLCECANSVAACSSSGECYTLYCDGDECP